MSADSLEKWKQWGREGQGPGKGQAGAAEGAEEAVLAVVRLA